MSGKGKQTRAVEPTGKSRTTGAGSANARAELHEFAEVKILLPLTPATDYGGAALQVCKHSTAVEPGIFCVRLRTYAWHR
jgi:hypothetical protein